MVENIPEVSLSPDQAYALANALGNSADSLMAKISETDNESAKVIAALLKNSQEREAKLEQTLKEAASIADSKISSIEQKFESREAQKESLFNIALNDIKNDYQSQVASIEKKFEGRELELQKALRDAAISAESKVQALEKRYDDKDAQSQAMQAQFQTVLKSTIDSYASRIESIAQKSNETVLQTQQVLMDVVAKNQELSSEVTRAVNAIYQDQKTQSDKLFGLLESQIKFQQGLQMTQYQNDLCLKASAYARLSAMAVGNKHPFVTLCEGRITVVNPSCPEHIKPVKGEIQ